MESSTRDGLQELFHKAFESFSSSVATETKKISMEVDERVAKRKLDDANNQQEAALANSNLPPTTTTPPTPTPPSPTAPNPTTTNAASSAKSGGTAPQTDTPPPKQPKTGDEETPEQKSKRIHDDAVNTLEEDSAARGRKAYESMLAAADLDDELL